LFNTVPQLGIMPNNIGYPSGNIFPVNFSPMPIGNISFMENNLQWMQQQMQYQQMLSQILFTQNAYSGWNNIPLFDTNFQSPFGGNMFSNFNNNFSIDKKSDNSSKTSAEKSDNVKYNVNKSLIDAGYDNVKGQKLANIAKKNATGFKGKCATWAKNDIQKAGLGKYICGDAYQCAAILDKNPNFKRVEISLEDAKNTPGIVLVFDRGVSGYSKTYGHIEITGGDGCAYSDGITNHIKTGFVAYAPV